MIKGGPESRNQLAIGSLTEVYLKTSMALLSPLSVSMTLLAIVFLSVTAVQSQSQFSLRGVSYPNYGTVLLSEIGDDLDTGLQCLTTQANCCGLDVNNTIVFEERRGQFYYPNGIQLPIESLAGGDGLFRARGYKLIYLSRLPAATTDPPFGLYRCDIPDQTSNASNNMFINIVEQFPLTTTETATEVRSTPATTSPESTTPEATTPEATTPEATTHEATPPEATTPEAITPEATTPEATPPEATTPEAITPEAITPEATTPETITPSTTTPGATIPESKTPATVTTNPTVITEAPTPTPIPTLSSTAIPSTEVPITETLQPIQLRLTGVRNCDTWITDNLPEKAAELVDVIVENVEQRCRCGFTSNQVRSGGFRCVSDAADAVMYQADLYGNSQVTSAELIPYIEDWTSEEVDILLQALFLTVDTNCPVLVSSDSDCQSSPPPPPSTGGSDIGAIIGGVVAVVLLLALTTAGVVAVVILRNRRHKETLRGHEDPFTGITLRNVAHTGEHEGRLEISQSHEYEIVNSLSMSTACNPGYLELVSTGEKGDYQITECPAYGTSPNNTQPASSHNGRTSQ